MHISLIIFNVLLSLNFLKYAGSILHGNRNKMKAVAPAIEVSRQLRLAEFLTFYSRLKSEAIPVPQYGPRFYEMASFFGNDLARAKYLHPSPFAFTLMWILKRYV